MSSVGTTNEYAGDEQDINAHNLFLTGDDAALLYLGLGTPGEYDLVKERTHRLVLRSPGAIRSLATSLLLAAERLESQRESLARFHEYEREQAAQPTKAAAKAARPKK